MHSLQSDFFVAGNSAFARDVKSWPQTWCKKLCKCLGEVRVEDGASCTRFDAGSTDVRVTKFLAVAVSHWISHCFTHASHLLCQISLHFATVCHGLPRFATVCCAMLDQRCHQSLGTHWKSEPRQTDTGTGWHRGYRFGLFGNRLYIELISISIYI